MADEIQQAGGDTAGWYSEEAATFGDRLAGAREAAGMSQTQLSHRLGVKLKTVAAWENDLREPRANKLQMIAGMLNVSIMWLLTGRGEGLDAPADPEALPPSAERLLADLRAARAEARALSDRMGLLEKRLRGLLKETSL
ncbi:XRE family transcriptional regulator [Defluviimonas sp. 20V17]|uniref:Transcriptional regulator n=1 Tax=Allgaiera indica TaxID=765699 RepID=A0AAN4URV9_9RHOB|nr:helix-turn-helix transcriptional regulator [Allgaiera indica]KDB02241.1 XRE family transcriptional regulator [Defluviimonas sp. 20V17]GHE02669.1 transcriptional regulator [Allgaiera indica]SDX19474.1 transcriptional regulator, XRE family [Allgaiera indica]